MRISQLSTRTGVSVPTIKYYLREHLLPPGTRTARNQAVYGEEHLERIRMIRVFTEIGGIGLASLRAIFDAAADQDLPLHELCQTVHRALGTQELVGVESADEADAKGWVDEYLERLGWQVSDGAPGRDALAGVLVTLWRLGWECDDEVLEPYARAADGLARRELGYISPDATRSEAAATVVVGTLLFELALVALRRMAQEHHSALKFRGAAVERAGPDNRHDPPA